MWPNCKIFHISFAELKHSTAGYFTSKRWVYSRMVENYNLGQARAKERYALYWRKGSCKHKVHRDKLGVGYNGGFSLTEL